MAQRVEIDQRDREFLERIGEFRNGLTTKEKAVIDTVMARALEADEADVAVHAKPVEVEPLGEQEMETLVAKIDAFQATLAERDRGRLDILLRKGSRDGEPDVEAHEWQFLWSATVPTAMYWATWADCALEGGELYTTRTWWPREWWAPRIPMGQYDCWRWNPE